MLKGFSVPLSPSGKSSLSNLPPWHYSSDCLVVEYWADPAAIADVLPPGVTPDEVSSGRAFFWFLDWQFTASNEEVMRRYFPQLAKELQSKPLVDQLTMSLTDNLTIVSVWAGAAELKVPEVYGEEMHLIGPRKVGRGYRLGMSYSVTDLRILKDYNE